MGGAVAQEIKEQGRDLDFGRKVRWLPIEGGDTLLRSAIMPDHPE
jgi:hypothetical protein